MTTVRLAHVDGAQGDCVLKGERGLKRLEAEQAPALLISYYYLKGWLKHQEKYMYRDWVMDSGAFSAFNSGKVVDLDAYIECCQELLEKDPTLTEIYALDVIGDHKASLKNAERMWEAGVEAIPTYHLGSPVEALKYIAREYPKIAIGGCAREKKPVKMQFIGACFSNVWPKRIHGFGLSHEDYVLAFPFESVDATNWELGPCGFGRWKTFGKMSVTGSSQNLRSEVEWHLKLERRAKAQWKKELDQIGSPMDERAVRLAVQPGGRSHNLHTDIQKPKPKKKRRRKQ